MADKNTPTPCLDATFKATNPYRRNRQLLDWLSNDEHRAQLFALINQQHNGVLELPGRDVTRPECGTPDDDHPRPPPVVEHEAVFLITKREQIEEALRDGGRKYSNRRYGDLGGGNFMLALDPAAMAGDAHRLQRLALRASFPHDRALLCKVARHACESAAILGLRGQEFDLAAFAEQIGARFVQHLMGYAFADYEMLERTLRASYKGLVYQVLGRHFVTDPLAIPDAKANAGYLLQRTAALIDAYAVNDGDALKGCDVSPGLSGLVPVMKRLGGFDCGLNGEQRAIVAVGAAIGSVGNVQAAVCIAVRYLFDQDKLNEARALLREARERPETDLFDRWKALIAPALRRNPPIPFLPRVRIVTEVNGQQRYEELLLALGGATNPDDDKGNPDDPLVWGLPESGRHWCLGMYLAWPLIVESVRYVMALPKLAEGRDPVDATVVGLEKRWGFACERYPMTHRRDLRLAQSSLNVAMRIRPPVKDNADRLRAVIRAGAPRIDEALRQARHVHFAWFELIEGDTVLVLHTVYDGQFAAYIQHFALSVGDLFDKLFEYIEDPPPMPVGKFPNEFVAHIQRYNRPPAVGYFFSAYPRSEAAHIMRNEATRP